MLKMCKNAGLHTCIDTSGTGYNKEYLDEVLKYTDLVILDIKAIDDIGYKEMTGKEMIEFNYFVERLNKSNNKVWIRQVIIPNINDNEQYILKLKKYIKKIKNVEKKELLPYHSMGIEKYKKLNLKYRLIDTLDMDKEKCKKLEELLNK